MLSEAIEKVCQLARESKAAKVHKPAPEPEHVYLLETEQGVKRCEAEARPRAHSAGDLESLVRLCKDVATVGFPVRIWYSRGGVVALLDDFTRRDRVTLPLAPSSQIQLLEKWRVATWLDQATLVRTCRTLLPGSFGSEGFVESLKKLKFRQNAEGAKEVGHGKVSVGKLIEAELTGASSLPPDILCWVPMFEGVALGITDRVRLIVEIDPHAEKLALIAEAGATEEAWLRAEKAIGQKLAELLGDAEGIYVYRGVP